MPTFNQLVRKKKLRINKKKRKYKLLGLNGSPQKKGTCLKFRIIKPKKPNSAFRKIVNIRLTNNKNIRAYISGQGHNLKKFSVVLVRGGHVRDLPGIKYKLIKGKYDFSYQENFERKKARSKYGIPK